jgi:hypothetical protein
MNETLRRCLEDLERRINAAEEERLLRGWTDFAEGRPPRRAGSGGDIFSPRRSHGVPPGVEWPAVSVNRALAGYDAMALQQFGDCSRRLAAGDGLLLNVRCNYGTSILPSLFGAEDFIMDEELDTLPTSRPLRSPQAIQRAVDAGVPDLRLGWGARVLEMAQRYLAIGKEYPQIGRWVHVYHPDLQGPMDVVELLWGSGIFYVLYDDPRLVHELLELVTATYAAFMRVWEGLVPPRDGVAAHWGYLHRGCIMLRDDSAMNLSPGMFDEFVRPYDQRLLGEFGGGAVHFCGRGDHFIASMSQMPGLHAVHVSQPELNDMEVIFRQTVDRGINLLGLSRAAAEAALARGRPLHGRVHCG